MTPSRLHPSSIRQRGGKSASWLICAISVHTRRTDRAYARSGAWNLIQGADGSRKTVFSPERVRPGCVKRAWREGSVTKAIHEIDQEGTQILFVFDHQCWSVACKELGWFRIFKEVQSTRAELKQDKKQSVPHVDEPIPSNSEIKDHRPALLDLIKSLSPGGFERLSQRLLRESGFQHVSVTGKSGDGGIDGIGTLQVNPFVSFNVLFQCKRYQGAVTPAQVRDFRGAMMGRADKGLIITTGTFTLEAKKEARRDGVPAH